MNQLNQKGTDLIKRFESCKLEAYYDVVGVPTLGWGSTGGNHITGKLITVGDVWTQDQADKRLEADLKRFAEKVRNLLIVELSDNTFSALVSFAYNLGTYNLKKSLLLKLVNAGKLKEAAEEFKRWDRAGKQVLLGLTRRRLAEKELFLS